jgi:hypothetical protein
MFKVASHFSFKALEEIFRYKVFRLLISKKKITEDIVKLLKSWLHSGFNIFCGNRIQPGDKDAVESLARYIIWACFSRERMTYTPEESKVVYVFKNGKEKKEFEAPISSTGQARNGWRPCAAMELKSFSKSAS